MYIFFQVSEIYFEDEVKPFFQPVIFSDIYLLIIGFVRGENLYEKVKTMLLTIHWGVFKAVKVYSPLSLVIDKII